MASGKPAVDFNAIVQADRRRRKNEVIAQKIFDKARRRNATGAGVHHRKYAAVPSLASRVGPIGVGVKRRTVTTTTRPRNFRGEKAAAQWMRNIRYLDAPSASSNMPPRGPKMMRSSQNDQNGGLDTRMDLSPAYQGDLNIAGNAKPVGNLSIRGLASPYPVIVKNLAAGTTAADIESAMTPVGGVVLSCRLVTERPKVIAEIIFESKEGAENVVETFNHQSADGNILHVYHKVRSIASTANIPHSIPLEPRSDMVAERSDDSRSYGYDGSELCTPRGPTGDRYRDYDRDEVIDGSYGFEDRLEMETRSRGIGLYSDQILSNSHARGLRGDRARGYR